MHAAFPPGTLSTAAAHKAGTRLARLAAVLTAVTCGLLASAAIIAAAFARVVPNPGGQDGPIRIASVPATTRPRGHRRRHGRLANHPDRTRYRPGRGHRSRTPGPGTNRPPGRLRNHYLTRPRRARKTPARCPDPAAVLAGLADQPGGTKDKHLHCHLAPAARRHGAGRPGHRRHHPSATAHFLT